MPRRKVWLVVADGSHAKLFEARGADHHVRLLRQENYDPARHRNLELSADKPGRTFDRSHDAGRHAMEPDTDPKRVEKIRFARHLASILEEGWKQNAYNELILIAAPRTLGDLREALSERVRELVRREIDKDWAGLDPVDLEEKLRPIVWPHLA